MSADTKDSFIEVMAKSAAKFVIGFAGTVFSGWAVSLVWGWIAVSFLGAPALGVLACIALMLIRSMVFSDLSIARVVSVATERMKQDDPSLHSVYDWVGSWCVGGAILFAGATWHFILFPMLIALGVS
jgi:hypothetical protein